LYGNFRINQTDELIHNLMTIKFVDGDFGNTFFVVLTSRGFYVKYCVNCSLYFSPAT
jgi:hypothetical protein